MGCKSFPLYNNFKTDLLYVGNDVFYSWLVEHIISCDINF